jgi:hypothetical protein
MTDYNNRAIESQNELEKFKTDINLVGYLTKKEGYKIDNRITSNATTGLVNEETGSKIFVKTLTNGQQLFSDKKAPLGTGTSQGGTIIDYVKNYKNVSNLGEVRKILRQELNSGEHKVNYSQMINSVVKKEVPVYSQEYFSFSPLINTNYLNSRGIQNETIHSPTFNGRIGEKTIKSDRADKTYNSTVFPMYENLTEKVAGLEVKNEFYSGSFSGSNKQESFWKSNVPSKVEMPTAFIVESPLDALSHYELHNKNNKNGLIYYGTNGEIGGDSKRIAILSEYFEKRDNKFSGFKLGNDNDAAGVRFNINIIGNVNVKKSDINIKIIAEADQHYARITVVSKDKDKLLKFQEDANKVNNNLKLTTDHNMQYRNFNIVPIDDNKHKLTFLMNNRIDNLIPIEQLAIKYRNSPFQIERSVEKDFSKDLEKKLGIERTEVAYKTNDKGKPMTYSVWKKGNIGKDKGSEGMER